MFLGVMESAKLEINSKPVDCDSDSAPTAPLTSASVVPSVTLESEDAEESEALNSEGEACNLMGKETQPDMVKEIVNEQSNYTGQNSTMTVNSADSSGPQQENRSYASIVLKAATSGASNLRWTPTETSPRTLGSPTLSAEPTASPPTSDVGPQSSNPQEGGHSIYIRNLPLNATVSHVTEHVTEEFTKFGPINHGGVQVRIHKEFGYCYGFVEFQSLDSMQNAIKESPLTIGGRRVVVEEKKSTIRVGSTGNAEKNKCVNLKTYEVNTPSTKSNNQSSSLLPWSFTFPTVINFESYISPVQNLCSFVLCLGKVAIAIPINCPKMTVPAATHMAPVFLNAQVIGNAFVEQYFYVLRNSPELAYKFYNDTSIISRIDSNGLMTSLTTLKDIDEKIQSQDLENSVAEIESVDAQDSYHSGIIVVVTGSLSGTDDVKRKFTQTFFLAPQEKGYFVLNDVFRCVMESAKLEIKSKPVDCDSDSAPTAPLTSASVVPSVTLESEDAEESEALNSEGESCNLMGKETQPDMVKEIVNEQSNYTGQNSTMTVNSADSSGPQQENRSYASIVLKAATSGTSNLRWTPTKTSPRTLGSPTLSAEPTAPPPTSDVGPQSSNPQEVEGHSIYIRNLPLNATVAHVTEEFTKFGPINHGGVQVKIHKEFGYCYGFVEFQSLNSMQNAIKESPLTIGGRRVVVEEKKSTIRVGSTGNAAKNKCQYSNFRRRGYFGRGYGRNFRSQSKSNSESCTEYRYQRVDRS